MTLDDLLAVPYVANGRSQHGADCYGFVRMARVYLFDREWMPSHGSVECTDKVALTEAMQEEAKNFYEVEPRPGAIAAAFRGNLCTHIAIVVEVDGKPMILETDEPQQTNIGPRLTSIHRFKRRFLKVIYYDN